MRGFLPFLTIVLAITAGQGVASLPSSRVGIEGRLEAMLIGAELIAKPAERNAPILLQIASARARGPVVRYDFRFTGFVAGEYDLRNYLVRQDGSLDEFLPPLMVQVVSVLPVDHNGWLTPPREATIAMRETYKWAMAGAALAWVLMSIPLGSMSGRRQESVEETETPMLSTSTEQNHPLLEGAIAGHLDTGQKLQLERLLLTAWREHLGISASDLPAARARLRDHPETGMLLRALEEWLYQKPGPAPMDLRAALSPYAKLESSSLRLNAADVNPLVRSAPPANGSSPAIGEGD